MKKRKIPSRGFTLIELLVVIGIIGLLSSIVLTSLNASRGKARDALRLATMRSLVTALELYASDHGGKYPPGGWYGSSSGSGWLPGLSPIYMNSLPHDPLEPKVCKFDPGEKYEYAYIADSTGTNYKLVACADNPPSSSSILYDAQRPGIVFMMCQAPTNPAYCGSGI